jgi:anti-sigma regulatory factor (Ser/Thr protein kinase)
MQIGHVATFSGTRAGFVRAFSDLRRTLDQRELPQKARYECELVFEEVVTNILRSSAVHQSAGNLPVLARSRLATFAVAWCQR